MTQHIAPAFLRCLALAAWAGITVLGCGGDEPSTQTSAAEADAEVPIHTDAGSPVLDGGPTPPNRGDTCGNGLDDDDDGKVDNDCACEAGSSQRCYTGSGAKVGVGACKWGKQKCNGDASGEFRRWGECVDEVLPADERCGDKVDNDCDGTVDEDCGECEDGSSMSCSNACGVGEQLCKDGKYGECTARKPSEEQCNGVDDDCDGVIDDIEEACSSACGEGTRRCTRGTWSACSAGAPGVEQCNGADDDCDGVVDDIERSCSSACGSGRQRCVNGSWGSCSAGTPQTETCNGIDDDCDGVIDDDLERSCSGGCGSGVQSCVNGRWGSCSAPEPRTETCNDVDDDCDGEVDDLDEQDCSSACGEGTRTCEDGAWSSCSAPQPSAESCNLQDDDCDGVTDEGIASAQTFENECSESRVFLVIGGCNVCAGECNGYWVDPGESFTVNVAQGSCITISAFARTPDGDRCLDDDADGYVGETREICASLCLPRQIGMHASPSC